MNIVTRLSDMGIELPVAAAPVASYVPVVVHGGLVYVSGQLPFIDGKLVTGKLGDAGKHARAAVGVPVLPLNAAVEVDAIIALKPR